MELVRVEEIKDLERELTRPQINNVLLEEQVKVILKNVELEKETALKKYAKNFDNVKLDTFRCTEKEMIQAEKLVSDELKRAIQLAKENIDKFHRAQINEESKIETTTGVTCWRKSVPIEKVGLYIPGGSAPLFSTVLMLGIPAQIAGCKEVVLCTPCDEKGKVNPAVLYTANLIGIDQIFKIGGAQAIAAMAFGTIEVPAVYKIFGPGNQYVTKAKELVQTRGVAIDMPAGPSELLVVADESCVPAFVAADLLSQAEHGEDSQVVLLSNVEKVIQDVIEEIELQTKELPRKGIVRKALRNSRFILCPTIDYCMKVSNQYAPEHLILAVENATEISGKVTSAGSVFIGNYSCESAGDYASGTNHTLPTNGFANSYSGVSLDSFLKKITFQKITQEGIQNIGPSIEIMAEAEELMAHKNAVSVRLKSLK